MAILLYFGRYLKSSSYVVMSCTRADFPLFPFFVNN